MTRRILFFPVIFFALGLTPALPEPVWYKCTVYAGSHTGRYTFKIDAEKCAVYWKEIDTQLKIKSCKLPEISALKPSARDDLSVVWFNLKTGQFYDYLSGVRDRGTCVAVEAP